MQTQGQGPIQGKSGYLDAAYLYVFSQRLIVEQQDDENLSDDQFINDP
jgi:hypothetical protein